LLHHSQASLPESHLNPTSFLLSLSLSKPSPQPPVTTTYTHLPPPCHQPQRRYQAPSPTSSSQTTPELSQENRSPPSLPPSVMKLDQVRGKKGLGNSRDENEMVKEVEFICLAATTVGFSSEAAQHLEVVVAIANLAELLKDTPAHEFASVRLEWRKTNALSLLMLFWANKGCTVKWRRFGEGGARKLDGGCTLLHMPHSGQLFKKTGSLDKIFEVSNHFSGAPKIVRPHKSMHGER
ncbi:hypothetical protein M8C21_023085, partial [Ambrosia artemisiifolia]